MSCVYNLLRALSYSGPLSSVTHISSEPSLKLVEGRKKKTKSAPCLWLRCFKMSSLQLVKCAPFLLWAPARAPSTDGCPHTHHVANSLTLRPASSQKLPDSLERRWMPLLGAPGCLFCCYFLASLQSLTPGTTDRPSRAVTVPSFTAVSALPSPKSAS